MRQALGWLINNLPLMIMALILAALAWFVALEQANPTVERRYPQPVSITLTETPEDMIVVGTFDERVQVTIRTTQSVWDSLRDEDFDVVADLSGLQEGVHEVPVEVNLDKEPSTIVDVEPETVAVELDSEVSRTVPVRIRIEGRPETGYIAGPRTIDPREVTVQGPSSYVTRVVEGFAILPIQEPREDVAETVRVRPRDVQGDSVPYVSLTPEVVEVQIPIEASDYHDTLEVTTVLTGEIASGYRITDISIDPPTVTVFGNPEDLAALEQGFIETKPVNVEGAQEDVIARPGLNVPPQITVIPGQQVQVRVSVEAIQSSLTITRTPEIQGLDPGYTATVSPSAVQVVLNGPLPKLESLESDDVRVVLDLFELPAGTHRIEPQVVTPEEITAQSVIPATVQVRISEVVLPTPTLQATLTATITSTTTITD